MTETQTLFVTAGHTVVAGNEPHGPGSLVTIAADEAAFLVARGFLQDTPPVILPPADPNPAGIGLQNPNISTGQA